MSCKHSWVPIFKLLKQMNSCSHSHTNTHKHRSGKYSWAGHAWREQLFPWQCESSAPVGWGWEQSGDRPGFSNAVDGAARSQAWLLHWRTSVSGRLNGCLNTERLVDKGHLAPGRQERGKLILTCSYISSQQESDQTLNGHVSKYLSDKMHCD